MQDKPYRDLRKVQKGCLSPMVKILQILDLNPPKEKETRDLGLEPSLRIKDNAWKVLIYDRSGQRIISPLLKIDELREQGVTVNLPLDSDRQSIPGVPAVYLTEPNADNIQKIVNDIQRLLYDDIQIHFLSPCPRPVLELLATSLVNLTPPRPPISKVCDQYLNYICLDKRLFSLEMKNSYFTLKNPKITETEVDDYVNQIVTSLHSVFATLGQIPFIRYQPSTVGEAVAKRLCDSIGNAILSRTLSEIFSGNGSQFSGQECRPLLILIDRSIDVTTMVSHQWSYASLVQDVFEVNINRISHVDNKSKKTVYYDIDSDDAFWEKNSSLTLPEVTENLSKDISECKIAFDDLKKDYNIDLNENFDMKSLAPNTSALISAMKQVPLVTEKKRILDMHMKIATRIMDSVRERSLDMLFSAEDSVHKQSPSAIMSIIADKRIQPEDKLRLFIVYYLSNKDESSTDMSKFEEALKSAGCDTAPLKYLREVRKLTQLSTLKGTPSTSNIQQPTNIFGKVSNIGSKISGHLKESGVSSHIENLMSNVRQLLPVSKSLPVTRIIESLSENRIDSTTHQEYVLLDPKITSSPHKDLDQGQSPTRDSVPVIFTNVVVFVIGGGNVIEYHNAMETVKDSAERSLIYGTTEIASPQVFLEQLHALGMSKS